MHGTLQPRRGPRNTLSEPTLPLYWHVIVHRRISPVPTIATWNVNSVKARLPAVLGWLKEASPDVLLLQEIKCQDADFPVLEFKALGYDVAVHGQKSYNGVAILSRIGLTDITHGLPGNPEDLQARYLEATVGNGLRIATLYLPNGNPVNTEAGEISEKFTYKLAFMDRLLAHSATLLRAGVPTIIGGDFNVLPTPADCYAPEEWANDALMRPETRKRFNALIHQGWTEATRAFQTQPGMYSFWDYQAGAWAKNHGLRIDFLLASPDAADALTQAGIDTAPRGKEKASDHTPVWCHLDI
ncbi:MAG: exodeoxyribonuclease III [Rhodospirillaceae bacterium]|nr:exodeoxyribonuclease III [Rhodospirillaceae bacterium]